ncbi:MAG TPA: MaoC family dehydratase [Streptosporangiales bacterium]
MSGRLAAADVKVGDELPPLTVPVRRDSLVRYAGASGDFNPIHWNEPFARSVGLPDVIAHGMFTMGAAITCVTRWAGDPAAVVEYGVRFTKPVVVPNDDRGAELEVTGKVVEIEETGLAHVDLTVTSGGVKVLGLVRVLVALAGGSSGNGGDQR